MFEEEKQRAFRWRVGDGREVSENFVDVENGAKGRRAGLAAHPSDDFLEQSSEEKHAFGIGKMRDAEHGETRFAFGRMQKAGDVERFAFAPRGKAGRGEEIVQRHDQIHALLGWIELVKRQDADFVERRILHRSDEAGEVGGFAFFPMIREDSREQAELAALHRIGVDAEQSEQSGGRALHALGEKFGVFGHGEVGRGEGA